MIKQSSTIVDGKVKVDRYWRDLDGRQFFESDDGRLFFEEKGGVWLEQSNIRSRKSVVTSLLDNAAKPRENIWSWGSIEGGNYIITNEGDIYIIIDGSCYAAESLQKRRHSPDLLTWASRVYSPERLRHLQRHLNVLRIRGFAERRGKLRKNSKNYRLTEYLRESGYSGPSIDLGDVFASLDSQSRKELKELLENHKSPNNSKSLRAQSGMLSLEELVTYETVERWDYMDAIQRGQIKYKRHDFSVEGYLKITKNGDWFVAGPAFYEINPYSLEKLKTIEVVATRRFLRGDYLLYTEHGRYFHGMNGSLIGELDSKTLQIIPDQLYPWYNINGVRREQIMANGKTEKEPPERKILLRNKQDLYEAMMDIAEELTTASDYQPTNGNLYMAEVLKWVQKKVKCIGAELTKEYVQLIIDKDIQLSSSHLGNDDEPYSGYKNHPPHLRGKTYTNLRQTPDKISGSNLTPNREVTTKVGREVLTTIYSPITGERSLANPIK